MKKEALIFALAVLMLVSGGSYPAFAKMTERVFGVYTRIEIDRAETQAIVDKQHILAWGDIRARYITPAWGALYTSVPWMVLALGWLGVGACVVTVCMFIDLYRIKRRQLVMIWPNQNGELPVDASQNAIITSAALALLHNRQQIEVARVQGAFGVSNRLLSDNSLSADGLPVAPSYSELVRQGWTPTLERFVLGYDVNGAIYGSIDDLLSTLVIGRPGTGKTTLLRFMLAQLVSIGADVAILDPHGGLSDLADMRDVTRWYAEEQGEMQNAIVALREELDKRLKQRRQGKRDFRPLLLLVDEWNLLASSVPEAVSVATRFILEARKVRGYALISGQGAPAKSFGDSVARDALSSRYIGWTTKQQARMAGIDLDAQQLSMMLDTLKQGKTGRAILARAAEDPLIVAIPNTTADDLNRAIRTREVPVPEIEEPVTEIDDISVEIPVPDTTDEQIREWYDSGLSINAIYKRIGGNRNKTLARIKRVLEDTE